MKSAILAVSLLLLSFSVFCEPMEFPFNEDADEEIIVVNESSEADAFKVYVHVPEELDGSVDVNVSLTNVNVGRLKEGWVFLTKTPIVEKGKKWKSSSDYRIMKRANFIMIDNKSNKKLTYSFRSKHDKLVITVLDYDGDW